MTSERQKKFLFISSKFQTPADKVIKVSRGRNRGVQYLWREEGSVWVLSPFYQIPLPHQPGLFVNYRLGGIYACHYQTLSAILIGVRLYLCCLSQMCHYTHLISLNLYFQFSSVFVPIPHICHFLNRHNYTGCFKMVPPPPKKKKILSTKKLI